MSKKVLIVGTGLGGLSTGLRLASKGFDVSFVEKNTMPGGRLNQLKMKGFTFDIGPSFFSMPYEFEALMNDCGLEMPFEFVELDPLYTVNFRGSGHTYHLYKDVDKLSEQFESIEPGFKFKLEAYLQQCEALYTDTVGVVVKQNFNSLTDYVKALLTVNPVHLPVLLRSFWTQTGRYFTSKEVRQIFSLIAFFLGRTPFDTNAVYTLLSHIEFTYTGYYNVPGGMYTIVECLVSELKKKGARFYFETEIVGFQEDHRRLSALIDQNGAQWVADTYVINSDAAYFRSKVLMRSAFSPRRLAKMNWTMGYLTFYLGVNIRLQQVEHHNYFLGNNYESYARNVMRNPGTLEKPYYYVNMLSKYNPDCAPEGCEALFFVCPVPNLLYKTDWSDKQQMIDSIIDDFSERIQQNIAPHIVVSQAYTPVDWERHFNLYKGAGLGLSHSMMQVGALRPANYDEKYKNVFYVGASTVPGAGLPMAVIGSGLTAERVLASISEK